jgi:adenosine deaminase
VASYAEHPVDSLYRFGVPLGINTDARTITNISLSEEYRRLHNQFGWGNAEFLACNLESLRAAFVEESVKRAISQKLVSAYSEIED